MLSTVVLSTAVVDRAIIATSSRTTNEETNIRPQVFVQGVPEKEASFIAAGRGAMMKNIHRGQVFASGGVRWGSSLDRLMSERA